MALIIGLKQDNEKSTIAFKAGAPPRLPHVTDVFPAPTNADSAWMKSAAERGTIVHAACEVWDLHEREDIPQELAGYLTAWRSFMAQSGAKIEAVELRIGGDRFGYVGRLDRVLRVSRQLGIYDIKTGPHWPTHGPQTSAYEHGYRTEHLGKRAKPMRRFCVHLKSDGTYQLKEHVNVHDLHTFMAYLRIYNWEVEHGLRAAAKERD